MNGAMTDLQLQEVANAAADNCETLLVDAELLFRAGRHARAHALAALAFEEFGKHVISVAALVRRNEVGFWQKYWRRFRSHSDKLRNARLAVQFFGVWDEFELPDFLDRLEEYARADNVRKLRGLYVDVDEHGVVTRPEQAITREEAEGLIADVRLVLGGAELMRNRDLAAAAERARELSRRHA
jgi:AbiV family abortive infection protein